MGHSSLGIALGLCMVALLPLGSAAGLEIDLNQSSNFVARFDGAAGGSEGGIGGPGGEAGSAVALGDFNGDGIIDYAVGEPKADFNALTDSGSVYVIYGNVSSPNGVLKLNSNSSYNLRFDGAGSQFKFGSSLAAGDLNNDGLDDLVVGEPEGTRNVLSGSGSVYVIYGNASKPNGNYWIDEFPAATNYGQRYDGAQQSEGLGNAVAIADFNGDGLKDLVLGASAGHKVYVINASASKAKGDYALYNANNYLHRFDGGEVNSRFGYSLAAGDLNNDGIADLAVGGFSSHNGLANSGSVYVIQGNASRAAGNYSVNHSNNYTYRYDGPHTGAQAGRAVAIGDLNNDGADDLAIGADSTFFASLYPSLPDMGSTFVVYSNSSKQSGNYWLGDSNNYSKRFDGSVQNGHFGHSVAVFDLNCSDKKKLIAGAPGETIKRIESGGAYVIDTEAVGKGNFSLNNSGNFERRYEGSVTGDLLGISLSALAKGARCAILLGAFWTDFTGSNAGSAYVIASSDAQSPEWSSPLTNSTTAGGATLFSVRWNDAALLNYSFEFDNGNGALQNVTVNASMTGTANQSNETRVLNSTVNATIRWRVYAWDSGGRINATNLFQFNTTQSADSTPPLISFGEGTPANGSTLANNTLFVNVSVSDLNAVGLVLEIDNSNTSIASSESPPGSGFFQFSSTVSSGQSHTFRVNATDAAGNSNSTELRLVNAPSAPTPTPAPPSAPGTSGGGGGFFTTPPQEREAPAATPSPEPVRQASPEPSPEVSPTAAPEEAPGGVEQPTPISEESEGDAAKEGVSPFTGLVTGAVSAGMGLAEKIAGALNAGAGFVQAAANAFGGVFGGVAGNAGVFLGPGFSGFLLLIDVVSEGIRQFVELLQDPRQAIVFAAGVAVALIGVAAYLHLRGLSLFKPRN